MLTINGQAKHGVRELRQEEHSTLIKCECTWWTRQPTEKEAKEFYAVHIERCRADHRARH